MRQSTFTDEVHHGRASFIYDPGEGEFIPDEAFAAGRLHDFLRDRGFDRNFLIWATRTTVNPDDARYNVWTGCNPGPQVNGLCSSNGWHEPQPVRNAVRDGNLTVLEWSGAFVSRVCANWNHAGAGPVPRITGVKYEDLNANGIREPGEPGLAGWTIKLLYDGRHVDTTTTGADGGYSLELNANDLPIGRGTYAVLEEPQPGWTQSQAPQPVFVDYGAGQPVFAGRDFGNWRPAVLSGRKFEDMDADGSGTGDPPVANWQISLDDLTTLASPDMTVDTGFDGNYSFVVKPGRPYRITEALPASWRLKVPPSGAYERTPSSGDRTTDLDFGNYRPATVVARKWDDSDFDGVRDATEHWLDGWTIRLNAPATSCATASPDGSCSFPGLDPGSYTVSEQQQDRWRLTYPLGNRHDVTLRSGDVEEVAFGNVCQATVRVAFRHAVTARAYVGLELRVEEVAVSGVIANEPSVPRTGTNDGGVGYLLPGSYRLTLFLPDDAYHPDAVFVDGRLALVHNVTLAECEDRVVPPGPPILSSGKVTGGMRIDVPGRFATAGFEFQSREGGASVHGTLEFVDHALGLNLHTSQIGALYVLSRELAIVFGKVDFNGELQPFKLTLVEAGEPGRSDVFRLELGSGYTAGADITLSGGNVQIHSEG